MTISFAGRAPRASFLMIALVLAGCAAGRHHRDGISALERKEYVTAVAELAQASELKPGDVTYRRDWLRARESSTDKLLAIAYAALADNDRALAEQSYRAVLKYDHTNARATTGLQRLEEFSRADDLAIGARAAVDSGDIVKANELISRALQGAPTHGGVLAIKREIDTLQAQELMIEPSLGAIYKKPINLEFRDASIKLVFDALSRTTGINFIFDRDVRTDQRSTVFLKQTSLEDAINVILSTGQLEKKVLNASSVLIYPNTPAKIREYQDLIVRAFYLANAEAKQTANMLKMVLKLKDVYVDDKYNMVILRESPETIALVEKLIRLQDLEEPEVMLEIEVLEINRSRLLNAGVQWNGQLTVAPLSGSTSAPGGATTATMKLSDFKNLRSDALGITMPSATLNLQKIDGDANLLANPRIRVRDREKAKILIGDKVPVVTTTSTATFVTENIQYLDVGLKLEVEPDIHLRDEIGLKLSLEVSSLVSSIKTNNGSQAYQIGTRNFSSSLRLKDGETQILAGLISDEDRSAATKIPLLGELPLLGRLFGSHNDNRQKTEIVLSITPHLIRNIQRKEPAAESFWSGTEGTLRNKPLLLRSMTEGTASSEPGAAKISGTASGTPAPAAVIASAPSGPDAPKLAWVGATTAKVGEVVKLQLDLDSSATLRGASLQLAFNPAEFDVLSVEDGGYFNKDGKGAFSKSIDSGGGRASVGLNGGDTGAKGSGQVLVVTVRPKAVSAGADIGVIAMTPIGAEKAVGRPGLPLMHRIVVTQ